MNKTVYLLATNSNGFIAFGSGCVLTISECSILASSPSGFGICLQSFGRDYKKASANLALWASEIAAAKDGSLLYWDDVRECVTDELAPDEEVFAK